MLDAPPFCRQIASITQWIEYRPSKPRVAGSNPAGGTTGGKLEQENQDLRSRIGELKDQLRKAEARIEALRVGPVGDDPPLEPDIWERFS